MTLPASPLSSRGASAHFRARGLVALRAVRAVRAVRAHSTIPVLPLLTVLLVLFPTLLPGASPGATPAGASTATATAIATSTTSGTESSGCSRPSPRPAVAPDGTQALTLDEGSIQGSYRLWVPSSYRQHRPTPLVLLFYGFGSNPADFSMQTGFPTQGSARGDLVAVPQNQPGETEWQFSGSGTDATFVNALVHQIKASYCVDPRRVFATGFSAGAAFTIFYGCSHQGQIRAIATVAVEFQLGCTRPMPILAFHGTDDPAVRYQNGAVGVSLPGVKVRGTMRNMGDWARLDHCRSNPNTTRLASQVSRSRWPRCLPGTSVTLYTVIGGGHDWPGENPKYGFGLTTQQISANALILRYFASFH